MHVEPKRAIASLPHELNERCWGTPVDAIQDPHIRGALRHVADQFVSARALRGHRYVDHDNIHVYGPFPSAELLIPIVDHEALTVKDRDELVLQRDVPGAWNHYLLNANFLVPDGKDGGKWQ